MSHPLRTWRCAPAAWCRRLALVPCLLWVTSHCGEDAVSPGAGSAVAEPAPHSPAAEQELVLPPPGDRERAQPLVVQARLMIQARTPGEAMKVLNQALELDPSFGEAYLLRSVLYMTDGPLKDLGLSLKDIRMARLAKPDAAELLGAEANVRDQLGQTRPTIDLLEELLARSEGQASLATQRAVAQGVLGRLLLREDNVDAAERHLKAAEASGAPNPDVALSLSQVAAARGQTEEQGRWIQESLRRDPLALLARREHQVYLARQGREEEAVREGEIVEHLRILAQDNSTRFANDLDAQVGAWARLAELLPEVLRCRVEQVRLLGRFERHDQLLTVALPMLADGVRHPDVIVYVALSQAAEGNAEDALATADLLRECRPAPPEQMRTGLRNRIRQIQGDG